MVDVALYGVNQGVCSRRAEKWRLEARQSLVRVSLNFYVVVDIFCGDFLFMPVERLRLI